MNGDAVVFVAIAQDAVGVVGVVETGDGGAHVAELVVILLHATLVLVVVPLAEGRVSALKGREGLG